LAQASEVEAPPIKRGPGRPPSQKPPQEKRPIGRPRIDKPPKEKRPPGRPLGRKSKTTMLIEEQARQQLLSQGELPQQLLLKISQGLPVEHAGETIQPTFDTRVKVAMKILPYFAPRISPILAKDLLGEEGIDDDLRRVAAEAGVALTFDNEGRVTGVQIGARAGAAPASGGA
jgi:hypothetical protein